MKRLFVGCLIVLLMAVSAIAAATYGTVTVADTAIGFTTVPANSNLVVCDLETANIRYRVDGATAPTSSEGHPLNIGESLRITNRYDMLKFRAIRTGSTSGELKCTFFEE